jgi:hypothetical protein
MSNSMHHYYHLAGVTDLDVIRTQAYRAAMDLRDPGPSMVHHHRHSEECKGHNHDEYIVGVGKKVNDGEDAATGSA